MANGIVVDIVTGCITIDGAGCVAMGACSSTGGNTDPCYGICAQAIAVGYCEMPANMVVGPTVTDMSATTTTYPPATEPWEKIWCDSDVLHSSPYTVAVENQLDGKWKLTINQTTPNVTISWYTTASNLCPPTDPADWDIVSAVSTDGKDYLLYSFYADGGASNTPPSQIKVIGLGTLKFDPSITYTGASTYPDWSATNALMDYDSGDNVWYAHGSSGGWITFTDANSRKIDLRPTFGKTTLANDGWVLLVGNMWCRRATDVGSYVLPIWSGRYYERHVADGSQVLENPTYVSVGAP